MDGSRFDALSRSLAAGSSRRRVLRFVSAGGLAALLGRIGPDGAAARKKRKKKCRGTKKKCGKRCIPKANCCASAECPPGEACRNGRCSDCATADDCPNAPVCQEAACQDGRCATALRPAGANCTTNRFCVGNETCDGLGACQGGVPRDCDDGVPCTDDACDELANACVHAPNDALCPGNQVCDPPQGCRCPDGAPDACGDGCIAAGAACTTGQPGVCAAGTLQCVGDQPACVRNAEPGPETCDGLDNDCDGVVDNGFDLQNDPSHCGACGNACAFPNAAAACSGGECVVAACHPGFADCDGIAANGCEAQLGTMEHCVACGDACGGIPHTLAACEAGPGPGPGTCVYTCEPGFADCNGSMADGCEVEGNCP